MNAPVIRHEQRQHQTLTPRLQQAVRLLQLSSLDFAQEVNQAMGNNPFLEVDEVADAESAVTPSSGTDTAPVAEVSPATNSTEATAGTQAEQTWDGEGWSQF